MTKYLVEFSGEHDKLPLAELRSVLDPYGTHFELVLDSPGIGILDCPDTLDAIGPRLALCRSISEFVLSCPEPTYERIKKAVESAGLDITGSFVLSGRRILGNNRNLSLSELKRQIGGAMVDGSADGARVNMSKPDLEFKLLLSKKFYLGRSVYNADRGEVEKHHGRHRPFFSPISLHPKYARCMVNLARLASGSTLLDPFCGTGGILIEASSIGMRVFGSDISGKMIRGTEDNLKHFDMGFEALKKCDIKDCPGEFPVVDAVVTDPPYGRSSSTTGQSLDELYENSFIAITKMLRPHGFLVIMLPGEEHIKNGSEHLDLIESYQVYVHRSLTRHICVYQN